MHIQTGSGHRRCQWHRRSKGRVWWWLQTSKTMYRWTRRRSHLTPSCFSSPMTPPLSLASEWFLNMHVFHIYAYVGCYKFVDMYPNQASYEKLNKHWLLFFCWISGVIAPVIGLKITVELKFTRTTAKTLTWFNRINRD